eukprot:jgi/Bigna1/79372/fgenesh1_pg.62_\
MIKISVIHYLSFKFLNGVLTGVLHMKTITRRFPRLFVCFLFALELTPALASSSLTSHNYSTIADGAKKNKVESKSSNKNIKTSTSLRASTQTSRDEATRKLNQTNGGCDTGFICPEEVLADEDPPLLGTTSMQDDNENNNVQDIMNEIVGKIQLLTREKKWVHAVFDQMKLYEGKVKQLLEKKKEMEKKDQQSNLNEKLEVAKSDLDKLDTALGSVHQKRQNFEQTRDVVKQNIASLENEIKKLKQAETEIPETEVMIE